MNHSITYNDPVHGERNLYFTAESAAELARGMAEKLRAAEEPVPFTMKRAPKEDAEPGD
jgi:hypothetical protein